MAHQEPISPLKSRAQTRVAFFPCHLVPLCCVIFSSADFACTPEGTAFYGPEFRLAAANPPAPAEPAAVAIAATSVFLTGEPLWLSQPRSDVLSCASNGNLDR